MSIISILDGQHPHPFIAEDLCPMHCKYCFSERAAPQHNNVRWELVGDQFIYMFPVDPVTGEPLPYPPGGWQRSSEILR